MAALAFAGCGAAADEERERSDSERAKAALLRAADLPATWTQTDDGEAAGEIGEEELSKICPGYPVAWLKSDGEASATFESDTSVIGHGVTLASSDDEAVEQLDDWGSERSRRCLRNVVEHGLREGTAEQDQEIRFELGDVEMRELELDAEQRGMRVELTLNAVEEGVAVPVVADFVIERSGRAFSALTTMTIGNDADDALRDRLATLAGERLHESFG